MKSAPLKSTKAKDLVYRPCDCKFYVLTSQPSDVPFFEFEEIKNEFLGFRGAISKRTRLHSAKLQLSTVVVRQFPNFFYREIFLTNPSCKLEYLFLSVQFSLVATCRQSQATTLQTCAWGNHYTTKSCNFGIICTLVDCRNYSLYDMKNYFQKYSCSTIYLLYLG